MTNKPMLSERDKFETFWRSTMNVQDMDLHRCEFPMTAHEDQPYACHETERGRMTWMARAAQPQGEPVAWLIQCQHSGLVEQFEPNNKSDRPDEWSDSFPVFREPPAPIVRCSFCNVTDAEGNPWSGHHESVDGKLIYQVMGCKDHKHLVDALQGCKPAPAATEFKQHMGDPEIPRHQNFVHVLILQDGERHYAEAVYGRDGKFRFGYDEDAITDVEKWMPLPGREQPAPVADHTQCEECKGGTECGECGGSGKAPVAVAVVMPDRMKVEPFTTIDRGSKNYKAGYNAAIAEVAKLNGLNT